MNSKYFWITILSVLISFAGGFILANALNKGELNTIKAENLRLKNASAATESRTNSTKLSDDEIKAKIEEAEKIPENFGFQKGLGLALYRYWMMEQSPGLLKDVAKLLERAHSLNPDDYDVIVALGNVHFDFGQMNKDSESNLKARRFYLQALRKNPKDVNVITDLGLSYLLISEPDDKRALEYLEKSLSIDSKHEKSLQFITKLYADRGSKELAQKYFGELKKVNPQNRGIAELEKSIGSKQ